MIIFFYLALHLFGFTEKSSFFSRELLNPPIKLSCHQKIIVYSPFRTGSTLVYNILNYLCEDQTLNSSLRFSKRVIKTHYNQHKKYFKNAFDQNCFLFVFITIRDPKEAATSYCNFLDNYLIDAVELIAKQYEILHKFSSKVHPFLHLTILRYEEFNNNLDIIFKEIEKTFVCTISEEDKSRMTVLFNKETMKEIADSLGSFESFDPEREIRGGHINKKRSTTVLSNYFQSLILKKLKEVEKLWGY